MVGLPAQSRIRQGEHSGSAGNASTLKIQTSTASARSGSRWRESAESTDAASSRIGRAAIICRSQTLFFNNMPESHVSKIVADALKVTADGLSRWLGHPIDAEDVVATKLSLSVPHEVMCCCSMSVDASIGAPKLTDPKALEMRAAGLLLLAWRSEEAAWLVDQSLGKTGTSVDESTWSELERSAISETSNVVGCEFLNAIAEGIRNVSATDVSLMPNPPYIEQRYASGWMDGAINEVEATSEQQDKAWLATGTFQVASHAIHTRFAMVWRPVVWRRLTKLVGDSLNGGN